ncbi:PREDICTED: putative nitric oxide synthase isoform X2 [Nelumbo nucifera]|uniref:Nitric oxide synthase isoform X2 n=1 Tax=Nelumbo nucifera TaxID=4432 RepID=A0A1U8AP28_NELNU|nr:PREDICTED: putative nitric oxide synthase isoform X2 [Nelumbo nucifera]
MFCNATVLKGGCLLTYPDTVKHLKPKQTFPRASMAPKSLLTFSVSLSPFCAPSKLANPNPNFLFRIHHHLPTLVICKATNSQSQQQKQNSEAQYFSFSVAEPEGTGAAAPTRGQIFLERQQSIEAAALVLASNKKKKKKGKSSSAGLKLSPASASCYGCGAPLQTSEVDAPGYVEPDTYELKKKHRQLRTVLCGRCRLLSHGHMITAVGGHGGYSGGKQFISAEELREKLSHLRHEKALIVKLVDIVDFNGSFLARIRDLAGANPIILVITKIDLLPKETDLNCIGDWVVEATTKKKLNVLSIHLTSSKSLVGIAGVVSEIQKEKKGSANVGKSAFINALLKMMAQKDPVAAVARKYKPIQSAVPGTTLGPIQIDAFLGGGKLFDTPGVHLHHRQAAVVHSEDLPALAPQSRLRGQIFPVASQKTMSCETEASDLNGFSFFWGGLVRIDVLKVHPSTRLTFYGPKALRIHMVPTTQADEFYQQELGVLLTPPTGKQSAENWEGLQTVRQLQINFEDRRRPVCDVAISGLGWVTVDFFCTMHEGSISGSEESGEKLQLAIHIPKPVEIFVRPPMPVGKAGGEWYEYRELTEKEQELRPKWYF